MGYYKTHQLEVMKTVAVGDDREVVHCPRYDGIMYVELCAGDDSDEDCEYWDGFAVGSKIMYCNYLKDDKDCFIEIEI